MTAVIFLQEYVVSAMNQSDIDFNITTNLLNIILSVLGIVLCLGTFILMLHKDLRTSIVNNYMAALSFNYIIRYINVLLTIMGVTLYGKYVHMLGHIHGSITNMSCHDDNCNNHHDDDNDDSNENQEQHHQQ